MVWLILLSLVIKFSFLDRGSAINGSMIGGCEKIWTSDPYDVNGITKIKDGKVGKIF